MPKNTPDALFDLPCIIFAGGKSSRMGRNKALLPFGGQPTLAAYQYARLSPLFIATCFSVKTAEGLPKSAPLIPDDPAIEDFAPTAGFVSVFRHIGSERIFALSVDTPFVDAEVVTALLEADAPDADAVIARTARGIHPLCGIYHRRLLGAFEAMLACGDHRLGKMLREHNTRYVDFGDEERFTNVNLPSDYAEALEKIEKRDRPKAEGEEKHL